MSVDSVLREVLRKENITLHMFILFWSILVCVRNTNVFKSLHKEELRDFCYTVFFWIKVRVGGGAKIDIFLNLIKIVILFSHT